MKQSDQSQTLDSMTQAGVDAARQLLNVFENIARSASSNSLLNLQRSSCCEIPPACWLPRNFGTFYSRACPCGTALLRVQVTNCQPTTSDISVQIQNQDELSIKITPQAATLGPMERKWFTVAITIPEDTCKGQLYDLVVWIKGCNEHYARWEVEVADGASGTCLEAQVDDCPDYEHHWYDHFYCKRPCMHRAIGRVAVRGDES